MKCYIDTVPVLLYAQSKRSQVSISKLRIVSVHVDCFFLTHQIGISEILPWDRKSYLLLPMLSYPGCHAKARHWLYWNSRIWSSSDAIVVKMTPSCHFASQHIQELLGAFLKHKTPYSMVSKKKKPLFV